MITKERLEELIEQGATIWKVPYGTAIETKLHKYSYVCNDLNLKEDYLMEYEPEDSHYYMAGILSKLFETKEEAVFEEEFGCIERTQRLILPTWEEIQKYERFDFNDKYNHSYTLHYISGFNTLAISGWSTEYYAEATKENYTLACRKAKELFLGEKK